MPPGAVKLNKILYHSDFTSYAKFGESITGVPYMRFLKGPAPVPMKKMQEKMIKDRILDIEPEGFTVGVRHRFRPMKLPDLELFTGRDVAMIDEWVRRLWGKNAEVVSEETHGIVWHVYNDRQFIPYDAVFVSDEPLTEYDLIRTAELGRKLGWTLSLDRRCHPAISNLVLNQG